MKIFDMSRYYIGRVLVGEFVLLPALIICPSLSLLTRLRSVIAIGMAQQAVLINLIK